MGTGYPVAVTWKLPALPTVKVAVAAGDRRDLVHGEADVVI